MTKWIVLALKIAWVAAMVGVFVWYLATHWQEFTAYAGRIGIGALLASIVLLLAGKIVLAQASLEALRIFSFELSLWKSFLIYSLSQLGKYLPGGVWQYVGRVLLYRSEGLAAKKSAKLLVIEAFWLLGAAVAVGTATCSERLLALAGLEALPLPPAALAFVIMALWLVVLVGGTRLFSLRIGERRVSEIKVYGLELLIWSLLGVSFWALFPPDLRTAETLTLAVGSFALGWAGGYVVPFAPAGVGVREAIIVALVADLMPVAEAIAAVALSRLVWTATELTLGALAASQYRTGGGLRKLATAEASVAVNE